ncbi:MAG: glycosyltransferase family 2 protein [Nitrospirota bacterium]
MIPLSVAIITKDEEINIGNSIESVKDAAEIVVIDSFSSDKTVEICRRYTDRVFQKEWQGYARQKQMAVDIAKGPWVLILDADERVTPALRDEITEILKNTVCNGFYIPRKNFFLGKWIRHSGWWPDYTLRLFRKDTAFIEDREVHEKVIVKGRLGYLKNPVEHYTCRTISDFLQKIENYSTLSAEEMKVRDSIPGVFSLVLRPLFTFLKMFFLRRGFLDGVHGLILSVLYSYYTFLKYIKVWECSKGTEK